jgi:DNA polymerase-4
VDREILYVNPDDFHASLWRSRDPSLRGRPVVVAYPNPRGMVVAASYEARREGIRRGMTLAQARRLCPKAAWAPVDWPFFRRAAREVLRVAERWSPWVEPVGLEEVVLDYTGCRRLGGPAVDVAWRIHREVRERLGLAVSVGVAPNRWVSHVASRVAKRAGLVQVPPGEESRFLAALPLASLPGLGERDLRELAKLGIRSVETLAVLPEALAKRVMGDRGVRWVRLARGDDPRPVRPRGEGGTWEAERIFPVDRLGWDELDPELFEAVSALGRRLRDARRVARAVALEVGYADGYRRERGVDVVPPTAVDGLLFQALRAALRRLHDRRVRVRWLRVRALRTAAVPPEGDLFDPPSRWERLQEACDRLTDRFGPVVRFASLLAATTGYEAPSRPATPSATARLRESGA